MAGHQGLDVLIGIAVALLLTWLILIAALAIRRPKSKEVQLEAAYRQFSSGGVLPSRNRRLRLTLLVLAVLVILNVAWLGLLLSRASDERAEQSSSPPSATSAGVSSSTAPSSASDPGSGSAEQRTIQLVDLADSAKPFQTVPIQGTYHGGGDTLLRVQRWESGKWLDFPLPTKTDEAGRFTAYVELGQPGRYTLRVLDPDSGVTSKILVLVIKG
jgi:hypothetical protein